MRIEEKIENGIIIRTNIYENSDFSTYDQKQLWLSVCDTCEYKSEDICKFCNCIIESKMMLNTSKCPDNKW